MPDVKKGDSVKGKVTGVENYGIFLLMDDGYTGLIHISEISFGSKKCEIISMCALTKATFSKLFFIISSYAFNDSSKPGLGALRLPFGIFIALLFFIGVPLSN